WNLILKPLVMRGHTEHNHSKVRLAALFHHRRMRPDWRWWRVTGRNLQVVDRIGALGGRCVWRTAVRAVIVRPKKIKKRAGLPGGDKSNGRPLVSGSATSIRAVELWNVDPASCLATQAVIDPIPKKAGILGFVRPRGKRIDSEVVFDCYRAL